MTRDALIALAADSIALCTEGAFELRGANGSATIARGESLYLSADEGPLAVTGAGRLFVATSPR